VEVGYVDPVPRAASLHLTLDYQAPYEWNALLAFLSARAVEGVEAVVDGAYFRTVRAGTAQGWLSVRPAKGCALSLEVAPSLGHGLAAVVAKVRRVFDIDAQPHAVDAHLSKDPRLALNVKRHPGLRVPGAFEPFETAVTAILGQQVTLGAGIALAARLVKAFGDETRTPFPSLYRLWPTSVSVARSNEASVAGLGMPSARARTVVLLARALGSGALTFSPATSWEHLRAELLAIPGVGPWTAEYIVMRAGACPDAFPVGDAALARVLGIARKELTADVADAWKPWRSYATLHLWTEPARGRS